MKNARKKVSLDYTISFDFLEAHGSNAPSLILNQIPMITTNTYLYRR